VNLKGLLHIACQSGKCLGLLPRETSKVDLLDSNRAVVTIVKTLKQGKWRDETG